MNSIVQGLEDGFRTCGVELKAPTDVETVVLPWSRRCVDVARLHPVWGLHGAGDHTIGGVPNKFRVAGPPAIDRRGPEVAVAVAAHGGLGWMLGGPIGMPPPAGSLT